MNYIVMIARSHPGESSSSWTMDGVLKYLSERGIEYKGTHLNNLVFKIVPMMSVDGVFLGNYRTGLVGKDINRQFESGRATLFP